MPKSVQRCSTYMSNSSKEPSSIKQLDALARGELAALVLGVDARLAAAETRFRRAAARAPRGLPSWRHHLLACIR